MVRTVELGHTRKVQRMSELSERYIEALPCWMGSVDQNHICTVYTVFWHGNHQYYGHYSIYVRFWPTLYGIW